MPAPDSFPFDLMLAHAELVVPMDGPDLPGDWIAIKDGFIVKMSKGRR